MIPDENPGELAVVATGGFSKDRRSVEIGAVRGAIKALPGGVVGPSVVIESQVTTYRAAPDQVGDDHQVLFRR